jgi:hypothetical protein
MDTNTLAIIIIVAAFLVIGAALVMRKRHSETLRHHFGPEYSHAVDELGSRTKAEAELDARRKRVEKLVILPLSPSEAARFRESWHRCQERFVDDPHSAVREGDRLVCDLMTKRGYPMGDFEAQAADVSVHHPHVVHHYRAAHEIAMSDRDAGVDTESLRQALVHYRALFADLLEVREPEPVQPERERSGFRGLRMPDRAMARRDADSRDRPR